MKMIPLTRGEVAFVDDADFEWINQWRWCVLVSGNTRYAYREEGKKGYLMHRVILDAPKYLEVDHRNRSGLDNRRKNLRLATHQDNMRNRKIHKTNTSGFTGVHFNKKCQKWEAKIRVNGKHKYLGLFSTAFEASKRWNEVALEIRGEFVNLNT